jgi:hypothetical protein
MSSRILVCWTGLGEGNLAEKEQWIAENLQIIEATKGDNVVEYLAFSYNNKVVKLPDLIKVIYRKGIVFQYMFEELIPEQLREKYDYVLLLLDDINLHTSFSLDEYIQIYKRNNLNVLQCALDARTKLSHKWMLVDPLREIGRVTNMAEYFIYLMDMDSYEKYYKTFLSKYTFWGWGIDLNLWNVGKLRVGILDKWPIWHRILGSSYSSSTKNPYWELIQWPITNYICFSNLE